MEIKIVPYKEYDEKNFGGALCECTRLDEVIIVPRPNYNGYVRFKRPRCSKQLGLIMKGKLSNQYLNI